MGTSHTIEIVSPVLRQPNIAAKVGPRKVHSYVGGNGHRDLYVFLSKARSIEPLPLQVGIEECDRIVR